MMNQAGKCYLISTRSWMICGGLLWGCKRKSRTIWSSHRQVGKHSYNRDTVFRFTGRPIVVYVQRSHIYVSMPV